MNFLTKLEFEPERMETLEATVPDKIKGLINENQKLVSINLLYLKELGVINYKDVFMKYYDMFLLDVSTFKSIFDKYEKDDLIAKISKNINIVEYL